METAFSIISAVFTALSLAAVVYGAWLSLRFGSQFGSSDNSEKHA